MTEDGIDKWMRSFQSEHGELSHIGPDELRELAFALHDDIPLGYEASMRLGQWLLHATIGVGECEVMSTEDTCDFVYERHVLSCGHVVYAYSEPPNFCPHCGFSIRKAMKR